jgi:uncharacterized protein YjbJ (UPF0337 family)
MQNKQTADVKSGTEDKVEGASKNLSGKVKEGVGKAIGSHHLEAKGDSEQLEGQAQKKVGEVKKAFGK